MRTGKRFRAWQNRPPSVCPVPADCNGEKSTYACESCAPQAVPRELGTRNRQENECRTPHNFVIPSEARNLLFACATTAPASITYPDGPKVGFRPPPALGLFTLKVRKNP